MLPTLNFAGFKHFLTGSSTAYISLSTCSRCRRNIRVDGDRRHRAFALNKIEGLQGERSSSEVIFDNLQTLGNRRGMWDLAPKAIKILDRRLNIRRYILLDAIDVNNS